MLEFTVRDCEISVGTGFFAVITLMLITCETRIVLISLLCSLFHEAGHIAAMLLLGDRLRRISFSAFGISIDKFSVTALGYRGEIAVSLAGIGANCLLSLVSFCCWLALKRRVLCDICIVSLLVGGFNLLPIDSLDGSRALRFALLRRIPEKHADTVIFSLSVVCVALLLSAAVIMLCRRKTNFSLIAATVYLGFLLVCRLRGAR